jgi:hypothetical protein
MSESVWDALYTILHVVPSKANADQVLHNFEAKICHEHCTNWGHIGLVRSTHKVKKSIVLLFYLCGFQRLH